MGTSGRNQYYGPGLVNYDFTALKNFAVWGERTRLTLRADFFNLFNHTNFANPVHSQSSAQLRHNYADCWERGSHVRRNHRRTVRRTSADPVFIAPAILESRIRPH